MTDLTSRLKKALAFDWLNMRKHAIDNRSRNGRDAEGFADGAKEQHARTHDLLLALVGCFEALELCADNKGLNGFPGVKVAAANQARAAVLKELERMEGGT